MLYVNLTGVVAGPGSGEAAALAPRPPDPTTAATVGADESAPVDRASGGEEDDEETENSGSESGDEDAADGKMSKEMRKVRRRADHWPSCGPR